MVPKLQSFHESKAEIRLLLGGNGTTKTTSGAYEMTCYATGHNPIRDEHYETPNETWAVCLRLKDQGPVMLRNLERMLPRDRNGTPLWKFWRQDGVIALKKPWGSEIRIKQQEEGKSSFYGGRPLAIWLDEEKAGETGEANFNQILIRRTPAQPLYIVYTMTPENGYSWTHRRLVDKTSPDLVPGVDVFHVSLYDCTVENGGFYTRKEIEAIEKNYPEYEREARIYGSFLPMGTSPFFSTRLIMKQIETAVSGKPVSVIGVTRPTMEDDFSGPGRLLRPRESGHAYIAAWDPSSGTGGDRSAFTVFDRGDLTECFYATSDKMDPNLFANTVVLPATRYYGAMLAVEVNGESGHAALECVRESNLDLYSMKIVDKALGGISTRLGWRTTEANRGRIFSVLAKTLREGTWAPSRDLLKEMGYTVTKRKEDGTIRADHPDGMHDDHLMAAGIALTIHNEEPVYNYPPLSSLRVRFKRPAIFT